MFSRPFAFRILHHQLPRGSLLRPQYSNSTWRYFASRAPRRRPAKPAKPARSPEPDDATLKFAGRRPEGLGALERRVAKEGNILLFQAPNHNGYRLGAYCLAGFCFTYSAYNSYTVFRDEITPIPRWLQVCIGVGCLLMTVMGTVILLRTQRLIKTINAFWANDKTTIRFTVRSMIPFRKIVIDVEPRQIAIARQLVVSPDSMSAFHGGEMEQGPRAPKTNFFRQPIKSTSITIWRLFRNLRQLFTEEDFIFLRLQGHKGVYRMDSNGFVSKQFSSIGSLVTYTR